MDQGPRWTRKEIEVHKITPHLWFDREAVEDGNRPALRQALAGRDGAHALTATTGRSSKVGHVLRYAQGEEPDKEGTIKHAGFEKERKLASEVKGDKLHSRLKR